MKFTNTDIPGIVIVEPDVHRDNRGFFLETYHEEKYREAKSLSRTTTPNPSAIPCAACIFN